MPRLNMLSRSMFIALAGAGLLSFGITAQAAGTDNGQNASASQQASGQAQGGTSAKKILFVQKGSQVLASSIMGMSIQNGTGKDAAQIGTINDLIMNKQHQLVGIVVGVGGFLGIGQKNVGIPWSEVSNINPEKDVAVVNVTKDELTQAPAFRTKQEKEQEAKQRKMLRKQRQESKERMEQQQKAQQIMRQKAQPKQDTQ